MRETDTRVPSDGTRSVGGMELFSDAVMAVAVVLLFLTIPRPVVFLTPQPVLVGATDFGSFFSYLGTLWATFVTVILTFLLVAAFWTNHHQMCRVLARTNPAVLVLNSLFLLTVGVLLFAAEVLAGLLSNGLLAATGIATAGAVFYGIATLAMALTFTGMWLYAMGNPWLAVPGMDGRSVDARGRSYGIACGLFVLAILLAFVTLWASLVLDFIIVGLLFIAGRHELIRPTPS